MPQIAIVPSRRGSTVVEVDPPFCVFSIAVPLRGPLAVGVDALVVNANYFEGDLPIGVMVQGGQALPDFIPLPDGKSRTALVIADGVPRFTDPLSQADVESALNSGEWSNATVIQAGPRLLRDGEIVQGDAEKFAGSGALRRDDHVGIGITPAKKLFFAFAAGVLPAELAELLLEQGAVDAMKVDGGTAAFLRFGQTRRGASSPVTALIVSPADA